MTALHYHFQYFGQFSLFSQSLPITKKILTFSEKSFFRSGRDHKLATNTCDIYLRLGQSIQE